MGRSLPGSVCLQRAGRVPFMFPSVGVNDTSDDPPYCRSQVPITSGGEGTGGVVRSWVLNREHARKIIGRYMENRGAACVWAERLILFKIEAGQVWLKSTDAIVCRIARSRIVAWVHPGQGVQDCERRRGECVVARIFK